MVVKSNSNRCRRLHRNLQLHIQNNNFLSKEKVQVCCEMSPSSSSFVQMGETDSTSICCIFLIFLPILIIVIAIAGFLSFSSYVFLLWRSCPLLYFVQYTYIHAIRHIYDKKQFLLHSCILWHSIYTALDFILFYFICISNVFRSRKWKQEEETTVAAAVAAAAAAQRNKKKCFRMQLCTERP